MIESLIALALVQPPTANPIPPSGGAIKFADGKMEDALPGPLEAGWKGGKVW